MIPSTHRAVWQDQIGQPGTIREVETPNTVGDEEVQIQVAAWGINPCDFMLQDTALPLVKYPVILGEDVAGTVVAVGAKAKQRFAPGDRVVGLSTTQGFQEYVTLRAVVTAKIPDTLSLTDAATLPLCAVTAAFSLFSSDYLGLPLPSPDSKPAGRTVVIWGGSSSVGSNAIQLATAAGLTVITTCSTRNFDYVKGLGAATAFDYVSLTIVDDVLEEVDRGSCAGIFLAAGSVMDACQVSSRSKQDLVVSSTNPIPAGCPEDVKAVWAVVTPALNEAHPAIKPTFQGYMMEALGTGDYQIAPKASIVSVKGLEGIQYGIDELRKGVSASKIIVEQHPVL